MAREEGYRVAWGRVNSRGEFFPHLVIPITYSEYEAAKEAAQQKSLGQSDVYAVLRLPTYEVLLEYVGGEVFI